MTRRRYELTDPEWLNIEPLMPNKRHGVPQGDDRRVLNSILLRFRFGARVAGGDPGTVWAINGLLQPVRPLAKVWCVGPAAGGRFCRLQRQVGDDRPHLYARSPARCDG